MSQESTQDARWRQELYEGLRAIGDFGFPKTCGNCGKLFPDMHSFVHETQEMSHSSGLMDIGMEQNPELTLWRNCPCGSTLMVNCADRRDHSLKGEQRRERFDKLLEMLVAAGYEREFAREELRKVVRGHTSTILDQLTRPL
jgi:hypothetical protein